MQLGAEPNGPSWSSIGWSRRWKLLRALLLQAFSVRSERQLMEQLDYNLLFRWFTGLDIDDPARDPFPGGLELKNHEAAVTILTRRRPILGDNVHITAAPSGLTTQRWH